MFCRIKGNNHSETDMKKLDILINYIRCKRNRKVYKLFINSQNVNKGKKKNSGGDIKSQGDGYM